MKLFNIIADTFHVLNVIWTCIHRQDKTHSTNDTLSIGTFVSNVDQHKFEDIIEWDWITKQRISTYFTTQIYNGQDLSLRSPSYELVFSIVQKVLVFLSFISEEMMVTKAQRLEARLRKNIDHGKSLPWRCTLYSVPAFRGMFPLL